MGILPVLLEIGARIESETPQKYKTQQPKSTKLWYNIGK